MRPLLLPMFIAALLLTGCSGSQALLLRPPRINPECEIPVCEKINKRDKTCWREYCMTKREMEEMTRTQ